MTGADARAWLEALEADAEPPHVPLAFLAAQELELPEDEVRAAVRRALFLLAAGGDPHRALELDAPAVERLARDLDAPGRREALARALAGLRSASGGLPRVAEALDVLAREREEAWRALAAALLAAELAES